MRETLKGLEADDLLTRPARGNADSSDYQISERKNRDRSDDYNRAAPMQKNFMEIIPCPAHGLHQHAGLDVGNVDATLNPRSLIKQRALVSDAGIRIWSAIGAKLLGA